MKINRKKIAAMGNPVRNSVSLCKLRWMSRLVCRTNNAYQISCAPSLFSCAIKLCNCCKHCRDENCTRTKFCSQSKMLFMLKSLQIKLRI